MVRCSIKKRTLIWGYNHVLTVDGCRRKAFMWKEWVAKDLLIFGSVYREHVGVDPNTSERFSIGCDGLQSHSWWNFKSIPPPWISNVSPKLLGTHYSTFNMPAGNHRPKAKTISWYAEVRLSSKGQKSIFSFFHPDYPNHARSPLTLQCFDLKECHNVLSHCICGYWNRLSRLLRIKAFVNECFDDLDLFNNVASWR